MINYLENFCIICNFISYEIIVISTHFKAHLIKNRTIIRYVLLVQRKFRMFCRFVCAGLIQRSASILRTIINVKFHPRTGKIGNCLQQQDKQLFTC